MTCPTCHLCQLIECLLRPVLAVVNALIDMADTHTQDRSITAEERAICTETRLMRRAMPAGSWQPPIYLANGTFARANADGSIDLVRRNETIRIGRRHDLPARLEIARDRRLRVEGMREVRLLNSGQHADPSQSRNQALIRNFPYCPNS